MDNILFAILLGLALFTAIIVPIILTKKRISQNYNPRLGSATSGSSFCTTPPTCDYDHQYLRHPCNCEEYYQCGWASEVPQLKSCSTGTVWDQTNKICNWPQNVPDCEVEKPKYPKYLRQKLKSLRNLEDLVEYLKKWFVEDADETHLRCDEIFPRNNPELDFHYEFLDDECVLFDQKKSAITCGWQLVRRVKAGNTWHPENDNLKGTAKYGEFQDDMEADATFSRKWKMKEFSEFLFATSDFEKWMIMSRKAVGGQAISGGANYDNERREIVKSSESNVSYSAKMYNRKSSAEDPWLSFANHENMGDGEHEGTLYGENGKSGHTHWLNLYGANVFIRSSCQHGGTCTDSADSTSYTCACESGYTGANCEILLCSASPCQNGGSCTDALDLSYHTCDCAAGFTGVECEITIPCDSNPCLNSGTCTNSDDFSSYYCACIEGFTGVECEITIPCNSNLCLNLGTCTNSDNFSSYSCACASGFTGVNCETPISCSANPCQNGGACTDSADFSSHTCACASGFTGVNCGTPIPCSANPCQNGGACTNLADFSSYTCACASGFTGVECEITITSYSCPSGTTLLNPAESTRSYSTVWSNDPVRHSRSMIDSQQAWSAKHNTVGQWMVIDLESSVPVAGLAIQGRYNKINYNNFDQWVTGFTVQYWLDGETSADAKNIDENIQFTVPEKKKLKGPYNEIYFETGVVARYIQITVQTWEKHISMRAGVLMCN